MGGYRFIIITLATCLIGVILLFIAAIANTLMPNWLTAITQELASVLIISGSVAALSSYYTKIDYVREIQNSEERLRNSLLTTERNQRIGGIGIIDAYSDSNQFDYSKFIENANTLTVSLNDGRTWLSNNLSLVKKHIAQKDSETTFLLIDPEGSYVAVLADRTNQPVEYQSEKIRDTCRRLHDIYHSLDANSGSLKIYLHELPPVKGVFITNNNAIITDYTTSRPRLSVPLLVLANTGDESYYQFIRKDIEQLIKDVKTQLVYHADKGKIISNHIPHSKNTPTN